MIDGIFISYFKKFTYHYVSLDCSKSRPNNDNYDFQWLIGEINISETTEIKYY